MAGEYLALSGGPALVLATEPRFRLHVQEGSQSQSLFHEKSPAGMFWNSKKDFFSQYNLKFQDPYQIGGFGASSAQFALLHAFWQVQDEAFGESQRFYDWHQMLADYRNQPVPGAAPSGADVIGAVSGGITWFDRNNGKIQTFAWPFQEIQFFVAHTGQKLATHEHLRTLGDFQTSGFDKAMQEIHLGLTQVNFDHFLKGLGGYRTALEKQGWVSADTAGKIQNLQKQPEILFVKGCGAMGSDVILALCKLEHSDRVRNLLQAENLKIIADSSNISSGLQIRNYHQEQEGLSL